MKGPKTRKGIKKKVRIHGLLETTHIDFHVGLLVGLWALNHPSLILICILVIVIFRMVRKIA